MGRFNLLGGQSNLLGGQIPIQLTCYLPPCFPPPLDIIFHLTPWEKNVKTTVGKSHDGKTQLWKKE